MIVCRIHHIRAANLCMGGARAWFAKHNLSWSDFLENGLPVEQVEALGDAMGHRVAEAARKEADHGRRG